MALAGIFLSEFDELDINKKEMLAILGAIKHWFADLANLKVKIYIDNKACVALLNYGITRSPFLGACLREIAFFLTEFNIQLRAEYITSRDNFLADTCSRAFSSEKYFNNFNLLLQNKTILLDPLFYNKFNFEYEL